MGYFNVDSILLDISIVEIIGMILIVITAVIYILLIFTTRIFHFNTNMFTVNYCVAALLFAVFYLCYYGLTFRDDYFTKIFVNGCNILYYLGLFVNCAVVYSLGGVSVNRLCMIVFHNKRIFKTKEWIIISVSSSWILAIVIPLPYLVYDHTVSLKKCSYATENMIFSYVFG
jgi:hypothetical protein